MEMNRKECLYSVAAGTAAIVGWVLFPGCVRPPVSLRKTGTPCHPKVAKNVLFRKTADGGDLMRLDDQGVAQVVCHVNEHGSPIVQNLNGTNTLHGLAVKLLAGFDRPLLEHTMAAVASFLSLLAQAGLLSEPFFVNLEASEITA